MFNPYSVPSFAASPVFWLLALYALTRGPIRPISLLAVLTEILAATYFLSQAMQANTSSPEEWLPWARGLLWGATTAPTAWYWLTVLLLRNQGTDAARRLLRWLGYPLGVLLLLASILLTADLLLGEGLFVWSAPVTAAPDADTMFRYRAPAGPLYAAYVAYLVGATLAAAANLGAARHVAPDAERRRTLGWLLIWAAVLVPAASSFAVATWLGVRLWPVWVTDAATAATAAVMMSHAGAYELFLRGKMIRADLLYFLTGAALLCGSYILVFVLFGPPFSFALLVLLVAVLLLTVVLLGLAGSARRVFDRLFFSEGISRMRTGLATVAQDAALSSDADLHQLVSRAQDELADLSAEHLTRLTQDALRRLNTPAGLADCGLRERLPRTIAALHGRAVAAGATSTANGPLHGTPTPLEQTRALRAAIVEAVERLKPADAHDPGAPAALQYHILHEAYVRGRPNKQIMVRRGISEGTFHRNRREAVAILARELGQQEERLAQQPAEQPSGEPVWSTPERAPNRTPGRVADRPEARLTRN